jgi:DNA repair exonuclease SbcCD ATPase subunit
MSLKKDREDTEFQIQEMVSRQAQFQNSLTDQISAKISEEAEKIAPKIREDITAVIEEFLNQQKQVSDAVVIRQDHLEQRVSELTAELKEDRNNRKKIDSTFSNLIKKMALLQNEQRNIFPELEKRIRAIEAKKADSSIPTDNPEKGGADEQNPI